MVLVWLYQVEVLAFTLRETILAVELDLGCDHRVVASHALYTGDGVTRLQHGAVPPVRVVEGLLTLPWVDDGVVTADERVALHNPHQLLCWVVEVQLDLVGRACDRLATCELQLLDQVLVGDLGEAAALISIQVDVVYVEGSRDQARLGHAIADHVGVGCVAVVPAEVVQAVELEPDLHLVVLQSNQREGQARVAAEPELQRDVQSVLRGALQHLGRCVWLGVGGARLVAILTTLNQQVGQLWDIADHLGVTGLLTRGLGQLIPDLEPVTVVLVDLLTTDLNVDVVDQVVANPVEPAELGTRAI